MTQIDKINFNDGPSWNYIEAEINSNKVVPIVYGFIYDDPNSYRGLLLKRERMKDILNYIKEKFTQLKEEIKWNEPMFIDHGTFIIGFSVARGHIAVAPEPAVISFFEKEIKEAGYSHTQGLFRIKWTDRVDFDLLEKMVAYNIEDKKDMTKFWR